MTFRRLLACLIAALPMSIVAAAPQGQSASTSRRADGSLLHWTLVHPSSSRERRGLLFLAQGSGCDPGIGNTRLLSGRLIAPSFTLLIVEKYGVGPDDRPRDSMTDCSAEYFAHHTVTQRVLDVVQVLGELRGAPWWDGTLVLMGGSEGGAVVARLASRVDPRAVIVFSSGLGEPLVTSLRRVLPGPAIAEFDAAMRSARADATANPVIGGNSLRWWLDVGDAVVAREMLKSHAPVLLIHGSRDAYAPVQSARAAVDIYRGAGRPITYWEYQGYDHFMTDIDGVNHREEVFLRARGWLDIN